MRVEENIRAILAEQIKGYCSFLGLLQSEKACLISLDGTQVQSLSKEKDTLLLKLRLLEEERIRLMNRLATEKGIPETITLQGLVELTGDEAFNVLRLQLISLLQSISELNDFNRSLTERSVNFTRSALGLLHSLGLSLSSRNRAALVSKEV
jgi:flagellar biosynthesis/type III secretory pathway chaperone